MTQHKPKKKKPTPISKSPTKKSGKDLIQSNISLQQPKLNRLDYLFAPLIAIIAAICTYPYIGPAVNWDDTLYMSLSQYTTPQAWILNRYGHIYFQKFFFRIAGDAITGGKLFWCFIFFSTAVLTYWITKALAGKKGRIIGIIAILFLIMQPIFAKELGCTLSDFTVMFFIALTSFIYLLFYKESNYRHLTIILLGLFFFWAVKSKETGLCIAVLFLGLGRNDSGDFNIRRFRNDMGWLFLGMFVGCLILMSLDFFFLDDAFFSIRPANIKTVLDYNTYPPPGPENNRLNRPTMSWYTAFTVNPQLIPLFVPFLLYLLAGWEMRNENYSKKKIIWYIPLASLLFVSFIRFHFWVIPRYFVQAVPLICIWAAHFFKFNGPLLYFENRSNIKKNVPALALTLLALLLACLFMHSLPTVLKYYKLKDSTVFYSVAIVPLSLSILLIIAGASKKRSLIASFLTGMCLLLLIYSPLEGNISSLKQKIVSRRGQWRYKPLRIFKSEFEFNKDSKILVSENVHKCSWMLGRGVESNCWIFNVFFNQTLDYDQFIYGSSEDILKGNYTYAMLTWQDWKYLREKHNADHLLKDYVFKSDKSTQLILLKKH